MRNTLVATAACLTIIAAGYYQSSESPPDKGGFREVAAVEPVECDNPDCACEDCKCEPCECPCDVELKSSREPCIYMLTVDWCAACKQYQRPIMDSLYGQGYPVLVVDVEKSPKLAKEVGYQPELGFPQVTIGTGDSYAIFPVSKVFAEDEIKQCFGMAVKNYEITPRTALKSTANTPGAPLPGGTSGDVHKAGYYTPSYQVQRPMRTGWVRGRMTRSACGPGGCR